MDVVDDMISDAGVSALRRKREKIVTLTQRCYEAALTPRNPGGLGVEERAALACRMARATGVASAVDFYAVVAAKAATKAELRDLAAGKTVATPRLAALAAHVDLVTVQPGGTSRADIEKLTQAGIGTADIVALSELIAIVNYQIRVVKGLELLAEAAE